MSGARRHPNRYVQIRCAMKDALVLNLPMQQQNIASWKRQRNTHHSALEVDVTPHGSLVEQASCYSGQKIKGFEHEVSRLCDRRLPQQWVLGESSIEVAQSVSQRREVLQPSPTQLC